jgi:hypothetical protein
MKMQRATTKVLLASTTALLFAGCLPERHVCRDSPEMRQRARERHLEAAALLQEFAPPGVEEGGNANLPARCPSAPELVASGFAARGADRGCLVHCLDGVTEAVCKLDEPEGPPVREIAYSIVARMQSAPRRWAVRAGL